MTDLLASRARLEEQLDNVNEMLMNPKVLGDAREMKRLGRERNRVDAILRVMSDYAKKLESVQELEEVLEDGDDEELVEMAKEEIETAKEILATSETELKIALTPTDPTDAKNVIVEIRAGAGGDEAALFARDIYRMYIKYCEANGFKVEEMSSNQNELGGIKEVTFAVTGEDTYGTLKFESGVHRVQRVPATEAAGRIHTSAVTVVVLPEVEDVEVEINVNDLKIDVYRSSGPGGQSVNTTDSAVRIKHEPTGIVVQCQDERSQLKNKNKAMKVLRARIWDHEIGKRRAETDEARRSMVSTGDRSAKIRTYNFPQGRVTDHRINLTLYNLAQTMEGEVGPLIRGLKLADSEARLQAGGLEETAS